MKKYIGTIGNNCGNGRVKLYAVTRDDNRWHIVTGFGEDTSWSAESFAACVRIAEQAWAGSEWGLLLGKNARKA